MESQRIVSQISSSETDLPQTLKNAYVFYVVEESSNITTWLCFRFLVGRSQKKTHITLQMSAKTRVKLGRKEIKKIFHMRGKTQSVELSLSDSQGLHCQVAGIRTQRQVWNLSTWPKYWNINCEINLVPLVIDELKWKTFLCDLLKDYLAH